MSGRLCVVPVFIAGLAVASTAAAQDPIKSNPKVYHLVLENSTVRVLHVSVAPGQKTVLHEHPDNAVVVLTDSKMRFTGADGKSQDADLKARDALWSPAGKHFGENTGTGPIDAVIVELKGNNAPQRPFRRAVRMSRSLSCSTICARGQSGRPCSPLSTRLRGRRTTSIRSLSPWRRPTSHCRSTGSRPRRVGRRETPSSSDAV